MMEEKKKDDNIEMLDSEKKEIENEKPKKETKKQNKELERLQKENSDLNDKVLRLNAEIVNIKRRYDSEISKLYKYDGEGIVTKILPIIDNFERAILLDDNNLDDEVSKFLSGFKMIYSNMINILKENNIVEIECLNKPFDPNCMDAVFTDKDDTKESGIVLDVMQKGYMYNDKVIRPAMVKVNE